MIAINQICNIVARVFHANNIKSACLAASMFCKLLIEKHTSYKATLVKGYVVMDDIYLGHFWLECDERVIDCGTKIWFLGLPTHMKSLIQSRRLVKDKPVTLKCVDSIGFEHMQDTSYNMCLNNQFWDDIENIGGNTIRNLYERLFEQTDDLIIKLK